MKTRLPSIVVKIIDNRLVHRGLSFFAIVIVFRELFNFFQGPYIIVESINRISSIFLNETERKFKEISNFDQHNPKLISFLKEFVILPPTGKNYNLVNPQKEDHSQSGQGIFLYQYFKDRKNGTFIEAGAYDGENFSNTLILERKNGWTGLLVEPNPGNFAKLSEKNRNANYTNSCISVSTYPSELEISNYGAGSQIIDDSNRKNNKFGTLKVKCFPIYSMMVAANYTTVDLFSLDIESFEVKILETIPWEYVDIKTFLIEVNHIPEGTECLKAYMAARNYTLKKIFPIDFFFVKNS